MFFVVDVSLLLHQEDNLITEYFTVMFVLEGVMDYKGRDSRWYGALEKTILKISLFFCL